MEGAALAAKRTHDLSIITAWHTAHFALAGFGGGLKGKRLSDFLPEEPTEEQRMKSAQALSFFRKLEVRGVPITISKEELN